MLTQTTFQVPANYTQQSHYDALKAGLIAAGWGNPIDEYSVSTTKNMVFKPLTTGLYAARLHIRIELTSGNAVSVYVNDGWNSATHTGPKETQGLSVGGFTTTASPINYAIYTSATAFLAVGRQGTTGALAGPVLLEVVNPGWDTALHMPWACLSGSSLYLPLGSGKNPWNSSSSSIYAGTMWSTNAISTVDPLSSTREIDAGNLMVYNSYGLWGYLPEDWGRVAASGTAFWDTHSTGTEVWTQVDPSTFNALVLRTA